MVGPLWLCNHWAINATKTCNNLRKKIKSVTVNPLRFTIIHRCKVGHPSTFSWFWNYLAKPCSCPRKQMIHLLLNPISYGIDGRLMTEVVIYLWWTQFCGHSVSNRKAWIFSFFCISSLAGVGFMSLWIECRFLHYVQNFTNPRRKDHNLNDNVHTLLAKVYPF